MESRPNSRFTAALTVTSATAARIDILTRNGILPGCCGLASAGTNNSQARWIVAQFDDLGRMKLISTISTTAEHERKALSWVANLSGSPTNRWFFAQAPDPEDEDQAAPENEEEASIEPQSRNAPAMRKDSSTEENTGQLRDGGTINPPFP